MPRGSSASPATSVKGSGTYKPTTIRRPNKIGNPSACRLGCQIISRQTPIVFHHLLDQLRHHGLHRRDRDTTQCSLTPAPRSAYRPIGGVLHTVSPPRIQAPPADRAREGGARDRGASGVGPSPRRTRSSRDSDCPCLHARQSHSDHTRYPSRATTRIPSGATLHGTAALPWPR